MSVEATKPVEETTPIESKPVEQTTALPIATTEAPAAVEAPKTETTETPAVADATTTPVTADATKPAEEAVKKDEPAVEITPASEGTLGYKAPGFLKQFHFSKHFFWFSEEPLSADALATYSRSEKSSVAQNASWARETGKGLLFFSKRAEDKAHPAGLIPLHDVVGITKDGMTSFSFDTAGKSHKFEASSASERDSWVAALEQHKQAGQSLKEDITGRESYKKNFDEYSKPAATAAPAAIASRSKSKDPKKSLDATTATAAATTEPAAATEVKKEESADAATITPVAPVEEKKKDNAKERSQSRKRASVFGSFMKKDEAKEEKKAVEKVEKQEKQEDKKVEAEVKKEEAKQEHDPSKATEAVAAAAVAAAPAAVISTDKKEEKVEPTTETPATEAAATTPTTEKKAKRGSVFGSLFNKSKVTSPTTEKTEKDVGPPPPAKDDVPPVSDTAPKLDEPIDTKPLDTAAVTAPANTDGPAETPKEATTPAATETKSEKKSFLGGFMKKPEAKKEETKAETPAEVKPAEPATAITTADATSAPVAPVTTDAATKSDSETPVEEKKALGEKEKRRTSLFGGLGTIKKKKDESEPTENGTERKREKSPLPTKIGGLFRKPSKAVKPQETKPATETKDEVKTETPAAAATTSEPVTAATEPEVKTEVPASTDVTDSEIIVDVVPEALTTQDKVATAPEVKASA